jgi:drug/metabolite transporter (DMT)-like permease
MKTEKPLIKYIAALLMFGTNGIVASFIALSSYEIVLTRTLIASLLLAAVFALSRQKAFIFTDRLHALFLVLSGMAMGASWMFLYEAYRQLGVGIASLAYYCGPVLVMILSPVLFSEKLTWAKLGGFISVLAGMFLVNLNALSEGGSAWGLFCGLMSAVMYAVMVIFNKKATRITGLENAMWQLLVSFLTVAVYVLIRQGPVLYISAGSWIPILILGIFNTGIGCYFYFSSIGNLRVQTVAICGYLEPLSAVVFSALFLRERMTPVQVVGVVLILGGAAFGELYRSRRKKPENSEK